jgi:hypothetical protein
LLLPALVLFVLGVAAARLLSPALRGLELLARRAAAPVRIALLSLARSPGEVLLTVVFFVLSVGIAIFAIAYRATLVQGERDQARYAVPARFVLQEDLTRLRTIQEAPPSKRYDASPIVRESGFVSGNGGRDFTLVALPTEALAHIDGWRSDFSSRSPEELARLLEPATTPRLRGVPISRRSTFNLSFATTGDRLGLTAIVQNPRGDFTPLNFGEFGPGIHSPTVPVTPEARGGRIVALRLSFPVISAYVAGHAEAETTRTVSDASVGTLRLGSAFAGWLGTGGIRVDGAAFRYVLNRAADSIIRPREPLEGELVPVVASPAIARAAGPSGTVALHAENNVIPAKIVATTRYFPSVDGDVVVADLPTWLTAANTVEPGVATPSELWVDAPPRAAAALSRLPLDVTSQRARERELQSDPVARGSIALLLVTAVVGLALAAVGLLLTVVGDLRDERGALFDLEAQGATPAELRRHVHIRAAVVGLLGLCGGIAAGAIVTALVVAVVTVTAGAEDALPPLALALDVPLIAAALGALVAGSSLAVAAAARRLR